MLRTSKDVQKRVDDGVAQLERNASVEGTEHKVKSKWEGGTLMS